MASHTMEYDVFDVSCFIVLVLNFNTNQKIKKKLFTLHELYKSEGLRNVPILHVLLRLLLHLLTYNCSEKFLFKKGRGRLFCPRCHFM